MVTFTSKLEKFANTNFQQWFYKLKISLEEENLYDTVFGDTSNICTINKAV